MTPEILEWVKANRPATVETVLEVGSFDVNGSPRSIFQDADAYLGIDVRDGPGVDRVCAAWEVLPRQFDLVLCFEVLEHDILFWQTLAALHLLVVPGGRLMISTPDYGFQVHRFPVDCYRFGEDTYRGLFFKGWDDVRVDRIEGPTLCGTGRKAA